MRQNSSYFRYDALMTEYEFNQSGVRRQTSGVKASGVKR